MAARGAQGAGRGGAHLRAHDDEADRAASTSTPTRARRSTAAWRPRRPRPTQAVAETRGEVVTYNGQPVVTYFFSTSGGRTEDVENTPLGNEPRPWLKSVDDPYDDTSPRHRWGPIRMTLKQAGPQARRAGARASSAASRSCSAASRRGSWRPTWSARAGRTRVTGGSCARASGCSTRGRSSPRSRAARSRRPSDAGLPADRRHRPVRLRVLPAAAPGRAPLAGRVLPVLKGARVTGAACARAARG